MKNKRIWRTFAALCTSLVLMGGFSVTAFAQGTGQPPETEQTAGQPTPDPGGQCGSCG